MISAIYLLGQLFAYAKGPDTVRRMLRYTLKGERDDKISNYIETYDKIKSKYSDVIRQQRDDIVNDTHSYIRMCDVVFEEGINWGKIFVVMIVAEQLALPEDEMYEYFNRKIGVFINEIEIDIDG